MALLKISTAFSLFLLAYGAENRIATEIEAEQAFKNAVHLPSSNINQKEIKEYVSTITSLILEKIKPFIEMVKQEDLEMKKDPAKKEDVAKKDASTPEASAEEIKLKELKEFHEKLKQYRLKGEDLLKNLIRSICILYENSETKAIVTNPAIFKDFSAELEKHATKDETLDIGSLLNGDHKFEIIDAFINDIMKKTKDNNILSIKKVRDSIFNYQMLCLALSILVVVELSVLFYFRMKRKN